MNHVTYHLSEAGLKTVGDLMNLLGYHEVPPDDPFEHGYNVRWFRRGGAPPLVHYVADGHPDRFMSDVKLGLGHFCVIVNAKAWHEAKKSKWCVRDSGSGRIWLEHDSVRIEVRPETLVRADK